ncbi:MAG: hypothetical protein LBN29_04180 [Mediterranea sp.]|nr:hypothetical protein [Mediterranea sp.]
MMKSGRRKKKTPKSYAKTMSGRKNTRYISPRRQREEKYPVYFAKTAARRKIPGILRQDNVGKKKCLNYSALQR